MIINSILNTDLYKLTMQNFALELFPKDIVTYKFKNRGKQRFSPYFLGALEREIKNLANLRLTDEEYIYLKTNFPYLTPSYIEYLKNFRYNPSNVSAKLTKDDNLELSIKGKWVDIILFEVPLMSIISELYFEIIDKNWNYEGQKEKTQNKIKRMSEAGCKFAEFGTRRRRSHKTQDLVIEQFVEYRKKNKNSTFVGTSNVYFAKKYKIPVLGTMGHEIPMFMGVAEGLRNTNYYSLMNWKRVFNGDLGIFLPDTYGVDAFLNNFTLEMAKLYDGLRWDSGDWKIFTDKIINHYNKLKINPMSKTIIYSDGLNVDKSIEIKKYCEGKIQHSFGIGTYFTNNGFKRNDGSESKSLNMVIKLNSVFHNKFEVFVAKLSDSPGKAQGHPDAIKEAKYVFFNQSLNE